MSERFTSGEARPVMTMAGIMPGGSQMTHWYNHIPFPNPDQLAAKREQLLAEIEAWKAEKAIAAAVRAQLTRAA